MGTGIEAARADSPEHAAAIDDMKDQLLIVLFNRLGGSVDIPVAEVDGTGRFVCLMNLSDGVFHFETRPKQ